MNGFFAVGKYAAYIWPAYGISAFSIAAAILLTLSSYRRAQRKLAALEAPK